MVEGIDNWIVLGSGRTGSRVIVNSLYALYNYDKDNYTVINPHEKPKPLIKNQIVHTHDPYWLDYETENTKVIISTRDPVDSVLSWFVKPLLNDQWHLYAHNPMDVKTYIDLRKSTYKVNIDIDMFIEKYQQALNVYAKIKLKPTYKVIDYSDWCDDSSRILPLLGYENIKTDSKYLILKNPGPHSKWIENYDELSKVIETLDRTIKYKT